MTPAKLNLCIVGFPYGGTGATSSEAPCLRHWFADVMAAASKDDRIGEVTSFDVSDTPITMTRCAAVREARKLGADLLLMFDSDNYPDFRLGRDPFAKPFFQSSLDFMYERRKQGLLSVVGAPYCGAPPDRVPFAFQWHTVDAHHPDGTMSIELLSREEAAARTGIHPVPALPTGCILFDMEVFEVTDPQHEYQRLLLEGHSPKIARALTKPWFYYEYSDIYQSQKDSTEDVTATRDIGLCVMNEKGYNPLFCNFDAWAGHWKPECVDKPEPISADAVNEKYRTAALKGRQTHQRLMQVNPNGHNLIAV